MPTNITEYKKTILEIFNHLTEIEIQTGVDTANSDPEKHAKPGIAYVIAMVRCRDILKSILEEK